jgi:tRNA threonylcarbamoyladenosine biosynthesis protein TsaE
MRNRAQLLNRHLFRAHYFTVSTPEKMGEFGAMLSQHAKAGFSVCLYGGMGTGKTVLASGFIRKRCLNDNLRIISPTYLLDQTYESHDNIDVHHLDLQRLASSSDLTALNLDHVFHNCISVIEWPDRLGNSLPQNRLNVYLQIKPMSDVRIVDLECHGDICQSDVEENMEEFNEKE